MGDSGFFIIDNADKCVRKDKQHRTPRRESLSGVIGLHLTAVAIDVTPPDTGAESVAKNILTNPSPASYHRLSDSDSRMALLPDWVEAFGAKEFGLNRHAIHVAGTGHPKEFELENPLVKAIMKNMAVEVHSAWIRQGRNPSLCLRYLTREEANTRKLPGVIHHGDNDYDRSDAWSGNPNRGELDEYFLELIRANGMSDDDKEEDFDMSAQFVVTDRRANGKIDPEWYLVEGNTVRPLVPGDPELYIGCGIVKPELYEDGPQKGLVRPKFWPWKSLNRLQKVGDWS